MELPQLPPQLSGSAALLNTLLSASSAGVGAGSDAAPMLLLKVGSRLLAAQPAHSTKRIIWRAQQPPSWQAKLRVAATGIHPAIFKRRPADVEALYVSRAGENCVWADVSS